MLTPNMRYDASVHVPPYVIPLLSIPVYVEFSDGTTGVCVYNHFGGNWRSFDTRNWSTDDIVGKTVNVWWGPVAGFENQ